MAKQKYAMGIIVFTMAVILLGCNSSLSDKTTKPNTIRIGMIASTTGVPAFIGTPQMQGALLAVKELEQQGREIEFILEDSPCDPTKAVTAYKKLSEVDKVDFIIGPSCSFENMAVAPLAEEHMIPTIALGAQEELGFVGNYTIAFYELPKSQGKALGRFLALHNTTRAGGIYFDGPYTKQLVEGFREEIEQAGKQYVLDEKISLTAVDWRDVTLKAVANKVDALYVEPYGQEIKFLQGLSQMGYTGDVVFGENAYRDDVSSTNDSRVIVAYQDLSQGTYTEFERKFIEEYGTKPTQPFGAAVGYDAVQLIANLSSLPRSEFKNAVISVNHNGAAGSLGYSAGQPIRDFSLYRIQGGRFVKVVP